MKWGHDKTLSKTQSEQFKDCSTGVEKKGERQSHEKYSGKGTIYIRMYKYVFNGTQMT